MKSNRCHTTNPFIIPNLQLFHFLFTSTSFAAPFFWLSHWSLLTLSCPGGRLGGNLVLGIHISPNNGLMDMISIAKVVGDVLAMHCEPSIISIGPSLMKLLYLYVKGLLACWWDEWKRYITKPVVVWSTWFQVQNWSIMSHESILHVQSCKSNHWGQHILYGQP